MAAHLRARTLQGGAAAAQGGADIAAVRSAGLLLYRRARGALEVLLVHPGGPFWRKKDDGAWTIPKGLIDPGEEPLDAARREFTEETGLVAEGPFRPLTPLAQPSGKLVMAWAVEGDCDAEVVRSNFFSMEWPPRSGKFQEFPEVDRAGWFPIPEAEIKIIRGQRAFLAELQRLLG